MGLFYSINRLFSEFGWKFVFSVVIVYGLNQGMGEGWFYALQRYYFKDIMYLTPSVAQLMTAAARTPWNIKPIYSIVSEALPIFGYRRTYYVALAGVVGAFGWGLLYITSHIGSHDLGITVLAMFLGCFANASPDVMIDAAVSEQSKEKPAAAADLHALCSYSASICGATATLTSGFLVQYVGVSESFGLMFGSSAIMLVPSLLGWLGEKPVHPITPSTVPGQEKLGSRSAANPDNLECPTSATVPTSASTASLLKKIKQETFMGISIMLAFCASSIAFVVVFTNGHGIIILISIFITIAFLLVALYVQFNVRFRLLTKVATFIFLRECFQLDTDQALFYWVTQYQHGPLISSEFVGYMATVGFCAMFLGVAFYNRFLYQYSYRKIFVLSTILCAVAPLLDFILLKRWNLSVDISDRVFLLIDFTINPMVRRLIYIPLCVLAARVCPAGVEATLFALLMSIGNFGHDLSSYLGALLIGYLEIGEPHYQYFPHLIILKSALRLVPLIMIPFLVPDGSPEDESKISTEPRYLQDDLDDSIRSLDVSTSPLTPGPRHGFKTKTTPQHHAYIAATVYAPEPRMISE